ncbi:XRE family transcriptional regulator [Campylobacter coli]|uniref:Helix-turn-helix transcriptional regulator n=1 Tax=Campylobacter coli TaxID=195 RepID=A0A644SA55_CAMCO|nr:XRE family transcriptional regulator [Campylobacter coli]EAI3822933.1 helix-turn-helix transcriptional regulator [Campylobacter coli]EAI5446307.1 helix-turn-helix transcriptional regulator [Campylobacter coli]EAJ2630286.1 helix-turn-helix transcriptional regulator [Campylobacter coli]EAJ9198096.1 helix-turn-helix transcriptional regulator [Campylobacter coli]
MFIREFRKRLNMTQSEFAQVLDIKQAVISRYENHKLKPTYGAILKLIEKFNANPNFLFFGKEPHLNAGIYKNEISQELNQLINELFLYENEKNIILDLENKAFERILSLVSNKEIWGKLFSLFKIDKKLYFITLFICRVAKKLRQKDNKAKIYLISIIDSFSEGDFIELNEHIKLDLIALFDEKITEEEAKIIIEDCLVIFKHIENTAPIHKMIELGKD